MSNADDQVLQTRTFVDFVAEYRRTPVAERQPFDVVVVGSGYGGSVAVHALAAAAEQAGRRLRLLLLERGKVFHPGAFPSKFSQLPRELRLARQETGEVQGHEGLFDLRLGPDVAALVANGVGGGSLINAGVMLTPDPAQILEPGRQAALRPRVETLVGSGVYARARRMLGAEVLRDGRWVRNNADRLRRPWHKLQAFREAAQARGQTAEAVDITVGLDGGPNFAGTLLAACNGCGDCMTGCNVGAKDSHDRNLLLKAQRRRGVDLVVVTGVTVNSLRRSEERDAALGLWMLRVAHTDPRLQVREDGDDSKDEPFRLAARRVVLAAGTLGSTEILLRSQSDLLALSQTVGASFSGNGDDVAALHRLPQAVHSAAHEDMPLAQRHVGPTTTARVRLQPSATPGPAGAPMPVRPVLLEEFSVPGPMRQLFEEVVTTGYVLSQLPKGDFGRHRSDDRDPLAVDPDAMQRTLLVGVIGHDDANGCLRLSRSERPRGEEPAMGAIHIHWPDARRGRELEAAHAEVRRFAERPTAAASQPGPVLVANPMWRLLPDGLDTLVSQPRGPVLTVHPLGGCRMGRTVEEGVVDHLGRVFDARAGLPTDDRWFGSLLVLDGSVIGASLGVNPALTIAAVALGALEELLEGDPAWSELGPPCREAAVQPEAPTLAPDARPLAAVPRPPAAAPALPARTSVNIVERMVSTQLQLPALGSVVLVLTLAFEATPVSRLIAPERPTIALVPERSLLRLYDAARWNDGKLKHADDAARAPALLFEAGLSGTLRLLHRGASGPVGRILGALWGWLRNRGMRDLWQRYVEPLYSAKAAARRRAEKASLPVGTPRKSWWRTFMEFVSLASRAGQSRLFEYRLVTGAPTDPASPFAVLLPAATEVQGVKRLRYERRSNPWNQLTRMHLTRFPGLSLAANDLSANPVLELDGRHLARIQTPLLSVAAQRDHAEALAELLSLGLYLFRVLLDVHLWSFRKPDDAKRRDVERLPGALPEMPAPQITWLTVDSWPRGTAQQGQPVKVRLARYAQRGEVRGNPLVMIHGYSASGTTFAHPSVDPSAASFFWKEKRDVWVLDLRSSCGLDSAHHPWAMEQVALVDIPAALLHVRRATGLQVDVLAHCIGGAMLSMALLADAAMVRDNRQQLGVDAWLTTSQFGVLTAFNGVNPQGGRHPTVGRVVLSQKGPRMRYTDANVLRAYILQYVRRYFLSDNYQFRPGANPGVAEQLVDRLLYSLPYPDADYDRENPLRPWAQTGWTASRHRIDALFGATFTAANLRPQTLEAIDDFFGPLHLDTVAQTIHFARWDTITDQRGRGEFVTGQRLRDRWGGIQTLLLHGADNKLVDAYTVHLLERLFTDAGVPITRSEPLADTGHQDTLIGRHAARAFKRIEDFLSAPSSAGSQEAQAPQGLMRHVLDACWLGPRITLSDATRSKTAVAVMTRPDQGESVLWLVPTRARLDVAGRWTGFAPISPQEMPWTPGHRGNSRQWLFATPSLDKDVRLAADERLGWLCLSVYGWGETMAYIPVQEKPRAQRVVPGEPDTSEHTHPDGPVRQSAVRQPSPVGDRRPIIRGPGFQERVPRPIIDGPGFPLSHTITLRLDSAVARALAVDASEPGGAGEDGVTAQELMDDLATWCAEPQALAALQQVFVRADDLRRASDLAARPLRFALASCQYPAGLFDREAAGRSLARLARAGDEVGLALMVGDQIYADATAGLVDPTRSDELYDWPHQRALHLPAMRSVMQRMPVAMLPDDHELFDNWQQLPPGPQVHDASTRRARLSRRLDRARDEGRKAYLLYQRMESPKAAVDHEFEAGGHAFFMLDTRTQRSRGRPSVPGMESHIVGASQRDQLEKWLVQHRHQVKFIASPSVLLPQRLQTAAAPANACLSDAWDGFPDSMRWLLNFIAREQLAKVVFLSGDEHHSFFSEIWLGGSDIKLVSVHASALYAPYPFANGQPSDFPEQQVITEYGIPVRVRTQFVPAGDGFALLDVVGDAKAPQLRIEFCKGGGEGDVPFLVPLT